MLGMETWTLLMVVVGEMGDKGGGGLSKCFPCLTHQLFPFGCLPQRQDARIIVGLFYETEARKVFCEVRAREGAGLSTGAAGAKVPA